MTVTWQVRLSSFMSNKVKYNDLRRLIATKLRTNVGFYVQVQGARPYEI